MTHVVRLVVSRKPASRAAAPRQRASFAAMSIRWDNATPLPAAVADALAAAINAMPSRAETVHEAWWAAVMDDPRVRPRKPVHDSFVRLREHTAPTIELMCHVCGIERRSFATADALAAYGPDQTMAALRPLLLRCTFRRCAARYRG
jgi:hypothetical protein